MIQAAESKALEMYAGQEAARQQEILENKAVHQTEDKDIPGKETMPPEGQAGFLVEEDMEIDDFEIVSPEFFSQIKEPSFTVNVNKVYVNAACVRLLPDVEYVKILVSRKRKQVAFEPSDEMDIKAYKWSRIKDGKLYASQRTGDIFVMMLCEMMGWDPDYRYKIIGRLVHSRGHSLIVFDLTTFNCYPKAASEDGKGSGRKRTAFPIEKWNGRFGPTYAESKRSLQVNTFDEYTVWTIKEGEGSKGDAPENPAIKVKAVAESEQ